MDFLICLGKQIQIHIFFLPSQFHSLLRLSLPYVCIIMSLSNLASLQSTDRVNSAQTPPTKRTRYFSPERVCLSSVQLQHPIANIIKSTEDYETAEAFSATPSAHQAPVAEPLQVSSEPSFALPN